MQSSQRNLGEIINIIICTSVLSFIVVFSLHTGAELSLSLAFSLSRARFRGRVGGVGEEEEGEENSEPSFRAFLWSVFPANLRHLRPLQCQIPTPPSSLHSRYHPLSLSLSRKCSIVLLSLSSIDHFLSAILRFFVVLRRNAVLYFYFFLRFLPLLRSRAFKSESDSFHSLSLSRFAFFSLQVQLFEAFSTCCFLFL